MNLVEGVREMRWQSHHKWIGVDNCNVVGGSLNFVITQSSNMLVRRLLSMHVVLASTLYQMLCTHLSKTYYTESNPRNPTVI